MAVVTLKDIDREEIRCCTSMMMLKHTLKQRCHGNCIVKSLSKLEERRVQNPSQQLKKVRNSHVRLGQNSPEIHPRANAIQDSAPENTYHILNVHTFIFQATLNTVTITNQLAIPSSKIAGTFNTRDHLNIAIQNTAVEKQWFQH